VRRFRSGLRHFLLLSYCHIHTLDLAGIAHARYSNARSMVCQEAPGSLGGANAVYIDERLPLASSGFAFEAAQKFIGDPDLINHGSSVKV
jgi:hypothetical protein